jgi:hypothetical protein
MENWRTTLGKIGEVLPRVWPWAAGAAGLALLGGLYYFLGTMGPGKEAAEKLEPTRIELTADQRKLSDDIGELESKYRRRAADNLAGEAAIALLEGAMVQQRELLRQNPRAGIEQNVRLDRLVAARDTERAKLGGVRIGGLESAAGDDERAGRSEAAAEKLREALQLQRAVNNSEADPRHKNFVRETRLIQTLETAEAEPLHRESEAALRLARTAAAEQRWADALAAFARARDAQAQLNQRYSRTQFADQPGLDAIEAEIASLNAAGAAAEIEALEKKADAAADLGRAQEAAELYGRTRDLQRELNVKFARSRFVSTPRLEALEIRRQTVLSAELAAAAEVLDRAAAACLLKRQVVAAEQKIADALALLDRVQKEFPKSRNFDAALKTKLGYLGSHRADLRELQDQIYDRLAPVPEQANILMLRTELPQEIYTRVMSNNPSRNPGRALPVDSASWHDAQAFCQRLSWLLGTRTRLPSEAEFRAALGQNAGAVASAESAGGRSQETGQRKPNVAGFADLAGNLAEWLEPASASGAAAPVAGGSYLDPMEVLKTVPVVPTDKAERARHIGFRVVVELTLE